MADIWVHEARTPEAVSLLAMELIAPQPWATDMAFRWIAGTDPLASLCGWLTMCRLLRQGNKLMPRSEAELRDHAAALSADAPLYLRKAAYQTIEEITMSDEKLTVSD